ncbi:uncharacterized protein LOC142166427 [Nicotiana tabacum]|uniref:Uncharacterized protein LOC142166427 n=1 Tax=Nicotiana tabacum TaxID=4097 RepID=A0AC58S9Z2_TOBAC
MEIPSEDKKNSLSDDDHMTGRGIGSQGAAERLKTIKNQYNLPFIFLQEPMINVLDDKEQQVLLQTLKFMGIFYFTLPLSISSEEKLGGLPYRIQEGIDFLSCLNDCNLQDSGFHGIVFTWSDNRDPPNTFWNRLDRLTYNVEWFDLFGETKVTHLSRICSDHAPLLMEYGNYDPTHTKYFKFLNIWVDHDEYLNVIQQSWVEEVHGNPLYILYQKTKRVCSALRRWSKATFGDIYEEPKKLEKLIKEFEEASVTNNTQDIRTKLARTKAEFTSFLILQEKVLRQKARVKWLDEGDANTTYFHRVIKDRRRKFSILKIKNEEGEWIEGTNDVASTVVQFFQKMFQADIVVEDSQILNIVKKEVKDCVFSIDPDSAPGPDGLSAKFYQSAWEPKKGLSLVIKLDMAKAYDRVSWPFLCFMLRQLGFAEVWIYMIYRLISNNWYSLIVNGSRHGFFNGIKQTLKLVLATLESYEKISGQMINKAKSCYAMAPKTAISTITRVGRILGMRHGHANREKHYWVAWKTLCFSFEEGGTGFRKLEDIYNASNAKQWWKFRTTQSLWAQFIKAKYCNGSNPKGVPFKMSFMILRAVHNKVATDERISSLGIVVDSRRSCCTSFSDIQGPETTNHLFYSDQYAQQVWNFFIGRLGIEYRNNNPRTLILNCWK